MTASNILQLASTPFPTASGPDGAALSRLKLLSEHQKELLEPAAHDAPVADSLNALVRAAHWQRRDRAPCEPDAEDYAN